LGLSLQLCLHSLSQAGEEFYGYLEVVKDVD
jgi:hypothetical protein